MHNYRMKVVMLTQMCKYNVQYVPLSAYVDLGIEVPCTGMSELWA